MPLIKRQTRRIDWTDVKSRLARSQSAVANVLVDGDQRVQEILHQRSRQLATRGQSTARATADLRALVVMLGTERYGLELGALVEVFPFAKFTPVPGAPPTLVGLINLRGQIRSVVSLSRLLELAGPEPEERAEGYIIMLRSGGVEVGVQVDQVERITLVSLNALTTPSKGGVSPPNGYIRGVSPEGVILLDVAAIVSHPAFKGTQRDTPPT